MSLVDDTGHDSFETEEERKARIEEAASDARKHRGAVAGQEGYDFQDFVTVLRIIDLARMVLGQEGRCQSTKGWVVDPPLTKIRQNAPGTRVDDLRIEDNSHLFYSQIKKGAAAWREAVVNDFKKEISRNRSQKRKLTLEYCVADKDRAVRLNVNRPKDLLSVKLWFEDINQMDCPHAFEDFCKSLDPLITTGARDATFENIWHQLVVSWTEAFRREATLEDVFLHASKQTKYTIRSLRKQTEEMRTLLLILRRALPDLYLTADGFTLLIREKNVAGKSFVHADVTDHLQGLRENPPGTALELYERLDLIDYDDRYED